MELSPRNTECRNARRPSVLRTAAAAAAGGGAAAADALIQS